jgi:hypothetical protein
VNRVSLRFYAELNDLLPPSRRQRTVAHSFEGRLAVKDLIEALGVPHTEVELIVANGESVDMRYQVQDGDWIGVYPPFRSIDISAIERVRPPWPREPRFILDAHLGRLAAYLRLLGFDTLYRNDSADGELARHSSEEGRILLTRDPGLLKRSIVTHGYWIRATAPAEQLVEVVRRFDLHDRVAPFRRCLRCNSLLEPIAKKQVIERLPPRTRTVFEEFWICRSCDQVYWKGSHYERMSQLVHRTLAVVP